MPVFRCPICHRNHFIQSYDKSDYICDNSLSKKKKFQNMENIDALTRTGWNFDRFNTKIDEYRDVTVIKPALIPINDTKMGGGRASRNW